MCVMAKYKRLFPLAYFFKHDEEEAPLSPVDDVTAFHMWTVSFLLPKYFACL